MSKAFWGDEPPIIRNARVSGQKRALARRMRREGTVSERRAWELLRNRRLLGLKFRRQQVIRGYIVDFYCAELRLALEIDGPIHHEPGRAEYDVIRSARLLEMGVRTVRLPSEAVSAGALRKLVEPIVRSSRRERPLRPLSSQSCGAAGVSAPCGPSPVRERGEETGTVGQGGGEVDPGR